MPPPLSAWGDRSDREIEPFRRSHPEPRFYSLNLPPNAVEGPPVHTLGLENNRVRRTSIDLDLLAEFICPAQLSISAGAIMPPWSDRIPRLRRSESVPAKAFHSICW